MAHPVAINKIANTFLLYFISCQPVEISWVNAFMSIHVYTRKIEVG